VETVATADAANAGFRRQRVSVKSIIILMTTVITTERQYCALADDDDSPLPAHYTGRCAVVGDMAENSPTAFDYIC